jgi:hypothetical protein
MRITATVITAALSLSLGSTLQANKYGSVEPIANPAVIDTTPLRDQPLRVLRKPAGHSARPSDVVGFECR